MNTFSIYEGLLGTLSAKLDKVAKKCRSLGCYFEYRITGCSYREVKDTESGNPFLAKFFNVEVEGHAVINGWRFLATVHHCKDGNIIRSMDFNENIPTEYLYSSPYCEHCHSNRRRKDTYLVLNLETREIKQVGKTCLRDYTNGMDAEAIAAMLDSLVYLQEASSHSTFSMSEAFNYLPLPDFLRIVAAIVERDGYRKGDTAILARDICLYTQGLFFGSTYETNFIKSFISDSSFNPDSANIQLLVEDALTWARGLDDSTTYRHNLRIAIGENFVSFRNVFLTASLIPAYYRHVKEENRKAALAKKQAESVFVGSIGQRISFSVSRFACVYSVPTAYGVLYIYQFNDAAGNVFIWKTSKSLCDNINISTVTGTVKEHSTYKGVKQTVLSRCTVCCKVEGD